MEDGPMTKGSDLLIASLENEGVDRIFSIPGEENLDVVEALRDAKIELALTRHEQAAAFTIWKRARRANSSDRRVRGPLPQHPWPGWATRA
jgi:hypothetical protein